MLCLFETVVGLASRKVYFIIMIYLIIICKLTILLFINFVYFSQKVGDNLVFCRNCNNKIHQFCIEQWQNRSETCPYCRHLWPKKKVKKSSK